MSSTNRGSARIEHDVYATPAWAVHRLLDRVVILADGERGSARPLRLLEPCAGNGAIIRAMAARSGAYDPMYTKWLAVELREDAEADLRALVADVVIGDFLTTPIPPSAQFDLVLTNPPFALAMEFIRACRPLATHTIMLLRLNFLGSEERSAFVRETTPDLYVLPNRCEFAMSISCVDHKDHKYTLPFTEARPKACRICGGRVKIVTADSVEYAWFHWHQNASGRYTMLASTPEDERKKAKQAP